MKIETTRPFDRDYARLPTQIQERVRAQLVALAANPRHPSLRLKRLRGTRELWEARVSRGYRLTLQMEGGTITLRRAGTHDILREP